MSEHLTPPTTKPRVPHFSAGPCAKRPGWSVSQLQNALVGRSHRSEAGKARLLEVIERSKKLLGIPADYRLGIVPASDTGAVEMALWSLLGQRPADVLTFESFSQDWGKDVAEQLKLPEVRLLDAPYGSLPDLDQVDFSHDVVFVWNGTTSGPWHKLDVVTYSWQKVLGGEAQHGVIILSPRAVERLESYQPPWPIPKIFRLTEKGKLIEGIFQGVTINTPSLLCVEDALDGLKWAESIGGLKALIHRCEANHTAIAKWVEQSSWADFLAQKPEIRSRTSNCLQIVDPWFTSL